MIRKEKYAFYVSFLQFFFRSITAVVLLFVFVFECSSSRNTRELSASKLFLLASLQFHTLFFSSLRLSWGCPLSSLKSSWQIASNEKIHFFQSGPLSLQLESLNVAFGKEFCSILFNWTRNVFFSSICLQLSYSRLIWLCEEEFPSRIFEVWRACAGKEVNFADLKKIFKRTWRNAIFSSTCLYLIFFVFALSWNHWWLSESNHFHLCSTLLN